MLEKDIKYVKKLYIRASSADPSPPLGTVLGNIGVNTVSFCTSFNIYTQTLPNYFVLAVSIKIFDNRSFAFDVALPSLCFILGLLKCERLIKVKINDRINDKLIFCVNLFQLLQLTKLKFGVISRGTLETVKGTIKAMNLVVVRN